MKFKRKQTKNHKLISITQSPFFKIVIPLVMLLLIGASFISGAYAHREGYTKYLRIFTNNLEETVDSVGEVIENDLKFLERNGLQDLYLDIPFLSQESIRTKGEEALRIGILNVTDEDFVPANVQTPGSESVEAKIRLKGDLLDHLNSEKWSLRIEIKNGQTVFGYNRFSIQAPETRQFLNEWAYHQHLINEDVLTTRMEFVNVIINGEHKGIYVLEESFSEALLEAQERREGVIIRFDEDLLWHNWTSFQQIGGNDLLDTTKISGFFQIADDDSALIATYRTGKIENDPYLLEQASAAIGLLRAFQKGELPASSVFDVEKLARYFAITDLWGAGHGTAWHNIRFYYNPITGLLEPIAYDGDALDPYFNKNTPSYPFSGSPIFQDVLIQKEYVKELERITKSDYFEEIKDLIIPKYNKYFEALEEEYSDPPNDPWEILNIRREMLNNNLKPVEAVRGGYEKIIIDGEKYIRLDLINQTILPVEIKSIIINDEKLEPALTWYSQAENERNFLAIETLPITIIPGHSVLYDSVNFIFPYEWQNIDLESENEELDFIIESNLAGSTYISETIIPRKTIPEGIRQLQTPPQPFIDDFLDEHQYIRLVGESELIIDPGEWWIDADLVIPKDFSLSILAGTTLNFNPGAVLFSTEAINILGDVNNPVVLTSTDNSWGGIVVLNAKNESIWRYTIVENLEGIDRDGWKLTGGITFFVSDLNLRNSRISNSYSEDAINIIHSKFLFYESEFSNTYSDAFDGDWTEGDIQKCSFHDITGDAIDVSGSDLSVTDTRIMNTIDKALSVGEESRASINNVFISNVGIGLASKDLSDVKIDNSTIYNAEIAALAAYIKKLTFGPAKITANNIKFDENSQAVLVQKGSYISLDGIEFEPIDLDVESLYASQETQ